MLETPSAAKVTLCAETYVPAGGVAMGGAITTPFTVLPFVALNPVVNCPVTVSAKATLPANASAMAVASIADNFILLVIMVFYCTVMVPVALATVAEVLASTKLAVKLYVPAASEIG